MKQSRVKQMLVGILIIIAGIGLFFDSLGLIDFSIFDLWPIVFFYLAMSQWAKNNRYAGGTLLVLGVFFLLNEWFHIGFNIVLPLLLIYFGYRMINSRKQPKKMFSEFEDRTAPDDRQTPDLGKPDAFSEETSQMASFAGEEDEDSKKTNSFRTEEEKADHFVSSAKGDWKKELSDEASEWVEMLNGRKKGGHKRSGYEQKKRRMEPGYQFGGILSPKESRSSLIGDFYLTSGRFELESLYIWNGIGDVVIDLSRALIQGEEVVLAVKGWIGDVTIYVPVDLPVSVAAEVTIGDLDVFGHRQGGISRSVVMRSDNFEQAPQKAKINISLIIGDIDVKYI